MSYPEFRRPRIWKDGASGHACISYKGIASYSYGRDDPTTIALNNLKVGESLTLDDENWGKKRLLTFTRTKENVWTSTITTDLDSDKPKKNVEELFTDSYAKIFVKSLKKALTREYYNDDLVVKMIATSCQHSENTRENGKITIYLSKEPYNELKTYYDAYDSLEVTKDRALFFLKFSKKWTNLRKVQFSRRISWIHQFSGNGLKQYLSPKSVNFVGRCQCDICIKYTRFQQADEIKAREIADIDLLITHINEVIAGETNEKFVVCIPIGHRRYFKERMVGIKIHEESPYNSTWHDFCHDDDNVRVIITDSDRYTYIQVPNGYDYSFRPFTVFMLYWQGENRRDDNRSYIDKQVEIYKNRQEREPNGQIFPEKRVQYASIQEDEYSTRQLILETVKRV